MTKYYKCKEVADICGVQESTVWSWIRNGKLKAAKLGRIYRISQKDLDDFTRNFKF